MAFSFEPVEDGDFEEMAALRVSAMRESLERIGRFDPARARERLRAGFSAGHMRHIAWKGTRVGFVAVKPTGEGLLLDHLYLLPSHQRRGIGGAVLERLFLEADAAGLPVRVGALRGSDANGFYLRHGFAPDGEGKWDLYYVRKPGAARAVPSMAHPLVPAPGESRP